MLRHRSCLLAPSICTIALCAMGTFGAQATPLKGNVEERDQAHSTVLQGGVKDDAALKNSLKVIPGAADKKKNQLEGGVNHDAHPLEGQVDQYSGGVHKTPELPVHDPRPAAAPNGTITPHVIPPISTYTLTPRNGLMIYDSGYTVRVIPQHDTSTITVPGHSEASITTHSGVSTYDTDYAVSRTNVQEGETTHVPGHDTAVLPSHSGITSYDLKYQVGVGTGLGAPISLDSSAGVAVRDGSIEHNGGRDVTSYSTRSGVTSYAPGYEISAVSSQHGVTAYNPGYQVSISTARDGIVCWQSGYETYEMTPGLTRERLGGLYFTRDKQSLPEGLRATPGKLVLGRMPIFVQPEAIPMNHTSGTAGMTATGLLLPQLRNLDTNLTWKRWYDKIGEAIYSRWQYADVVPGIAHVQVEVTRNRDLFAQVVGFDTARFAAQPEVDSQKAFCEAAVGAVDRVSKFEIPEFPADAADVSKVTFYVDMKRTVDSAGGYAVASSGKSGARAQSAVPLPDPPVTQAEPGK